MEEALSFLTGYHVVLYAALMTFACQTSFRRYGKAALAVLGLLYLSVPEIYNHVTGGYFWLYPLFNVTEWYTVSFLLYWFLSMAIFYACFRSSLTDVVFYGAAAYTLQWLNVNLQSIFRYTLFQGQRNLLTRLFSFLVLCILLPLFNLILVRRLRKSDRVEVAPHQLVTFLMLALFSINVFTQAWQHSYIGQDEFDNIEIYGTVFSLLIALLLLIVQFSLFEQTKLRQDKQIIAQMLQNSEKQYALAKLNIDVINRKCHDLRHQIRAIQMETDRRKLGEFFSEAEQAIRIYSSIAKTGNEALDVVLTEKSLVCEERGIHLDYMVNGEDLSFMEASDIYSLFGNILDNAIEAVTKCADLEKRVVVLHEQRRGNFIHMTVQNYCEVPPSFTDGLPETTHPDLENHGYGTKSIRYIVEKYGGQVIMTCMDKHFTVRAFFLR